MKRPAPLPRPGTSSYNPATGVHTVAGGPNGSFFHGWQYQGDFMVTARHDDATSGAGSARSGIVIRESSQNGATAWMGRIPTGSYNGFSWTPVAGGSGSGVPTFTGKLRWIRMIRKGKSGHRLPCPRRRGRSRYLVAGRSAANGDHDSAGPRGVRREQQQWSRSQHREILQLQCRTSEYRPLRRSRYHRTRWIDHDRRRHGDR
jgi:hypothetical protein